MTYINRQVLHYAGRKLFLFTLFKYQQRICVLNLDFFVDFFLFMYVTHHCFICRPSDSTVSEDAGNETKTDATLALTARGSILSARSHLQLV
jgi:hypothetical protein